MALIMKRPVKDAEESDELPEDEAQNEEKVIAAEEADEDSSSEEDESLQLKIKNARLEGELNAFKGGQKQSVQDQHARTKAQVFADANNLDDGNFEKTYKMSKHMAVASVMEQENRLTTYETKKLNAESLATSELSAKYGGDFYRFKDKIEESIEDLSEAARLDPKRLAKHMERQLKGFMVSRPKVKDSVHDRKKIVPDFEPPNRAEEKNEAVKKAKADEIAPEDAPLARAMGLKTESERLQYMQDYVPMNMGNGVWFKNPTEGFVKEDAA